ncbi:MAG TPA: DNA repair protein RadA [Thermomicrobiales bacterium]|nr:DNA repair protein RadA [Thermomicrobiales bacterium]
MAKASAKSTFVCQQCGYVSPTMLGRCPNCRTWDSLVETIAPSQSGGSRAASRTTGAAPVRLGDLQTSTIERLPVEIAELNRVLGGGFVPGSLVLLGGDPGIGKSTLVLQAATDIARTGASVLYVSGEESAEQIKLRADRTALGHDTLLVLTETDISAVLEAAEQVRPALLIVDSIQTMSTPELESAPGSVSQVRESAARVMSWAKSTGTPVVLIGHVTKEGAIAGPRVLEHLVDAVLYLEGDRYHQFRILRGVKNRFGSTNEIGVFEMDNAGLVEVRHPSEAFVGDRNANAAGSVVTVTLEGTRPILIELQALVAPSALENPRRVVSGVDLNRIHLLAAVLQKRARLSLGSQDIFVNVVGGLRVDEPAIDLALALAIASSFKERPIDLRTVAIGEIGLSGEIRAISQLERRLSEAQRLGYRRAIVPATLGRRSGDLPSGIEVVRAQTVREAINAGLSE